MADRVKLVTYQHKYAGKPERGWSVYLHYCQGHNEHEADFETMEEASHHASQVAMFHRPCAAMFSGGSFRYESAILNAVRVIDG